MPDFQDLVIFGPSKSGKSLIANVLVGRSLFFRSSRPLGHWGQTADRSTDSRGAIWTGKSSTLKEQGPFPCERSVARTSLVWLNTPLTSDRAHWHSITEMTTTAAPSTSASSWWRKWEKRARSQWAKADLGLLIVPDRGLSLDNVRHLRQFRNHFRDEIEAVPLKAWINDVGSSQGHHDESRQKEVKKTLTSVFGNTPVATVYPGPLRRPLMADSPVDLSDLPSTGPWENLLAPNSSS